MPHIEQPAHLCYFLLSFNGRIVGEFLSFILFIAAVAASFYLLFFIVLPAVVIYLGGISMVMLAVAYLVHREKSKARFMSVPLPSRTLRLIGLLSVALPFVHAGFMLLIHTLNWVLVVLSLNLLLSLAWLLTFLVRSRRAKKAYQATGGENRFLEDTLVAHKEALRIRGDALKCILDRPSGLEPWEAAVLGNDVLDQEVNRQEVERLLDELDSMGREIDALLHACRDAEQDGKAGEDKDFDVHEKTRQDLSQLEGKYRALMDVTSVLISQNEL